MADVLGILGFAFHAAHKVYTIFQSIRDAPNDIQELRDNAFQVHGLLKKLFPSEEEGGQGGPLHSGDIEDPQIDALVKKAKAITTAVDTYISKTTTRKDDGTYVVKKLKWPLYAGDAKALSAQFKAFYHALTAAYVVLTFITMNSMSSDLQVVLQMMRTSATIYGAAREQREGRKMRFDEICLSQAHQSLVAFPRADIYAGPSVLASQRLANTHSTDHTEDVGDVDISLREIKSADQATRLYDSAIVSPASTATITGSSSAAQSCSGECSCACHRPSSVISPIPSWLNPWLGKLNIPRALAASLIPSWFPCNDVRCCRNRSKLQMVRYYLPTWFVQVEASVRFESFPLHFCIQTPRVVTTLRFLDYISFDEFRMKLSTRELTLQDIDTNGLSVLHRLLGREQEMGDAFDLIRYALDAGIPQDWQYMNMTAVEYIVHNVQRYPELRPGAQSLDLCIVRPLLHDSLDEASHLLNGKHRQSDLVTFLLQPHREIEEALAHLRSMLTLPTMSAQIHRSDATGLRPIDHAAYAFPEAVKVLLQAGASTKSGSYLLHQDQWKTFSALIRAGYPVNERITHGFGRNPLHNVAAAIQPNYRRALELVRHGGHLLDWDASINGGGTPLQIADYFANKEPDNKQLQLIRELLRTQCIPQHAQFISSFDGDRLMDAEDTAKLPRISLIDTALSGDIASIGTLISAGAMVNERDEEGHTLLHLIAMGNCVPNAYRAALELVRHGGRRGVDWDAETANGETAWEIVEERLERDDLDEDTRMELEQIYELLEWRRLPPGESYVFPRMDSSFCRKCESLRCTCIENDVPGMPGSFIN